MNACKTRHESVRRLDIGCGNAKREGYFGVDLAQAPAVDCVHDIATTEWPFNDNQIESIYSNHCFEHLRCPLIFLREMLRVCRHGAEIEIWTPYGRSNEAFGYGHFVFLTEMHWRHICWEYDRHYLADGHGYFDWVSTNYAVDPSVVNDLRQLGIPIEFAVKHMFNISPEWGVKLVVKKDRLRAPGPQIPNIAFSAVGYRSKTIDITAVSKPGIRADLSGGMRAAGTCARIFGLLRRTF